MWTYLRPESVVGFLERVYYGHWPGKRALTSNEAKLHTRHLDGQPHRWERAHTFNQQVGKGGLPLFIRENDPNEGHLPEAHSNERLQLPEQPAGLREPQAQRAPHGFADDRPAWLSDPEDTTV